MNDLQARINSLRHRPQIAGLEKSFEAIDRVTDAETTRPVAITEPKPPQYGEPQRDAIASVVDGVVRDVIEKIHALHKQLDAMEQKVLEGAAAAKNTLTEQIGVCVLVNDEINHMRDVIGEIDQRFSRDA